jgi:hypothetical protein
MPDLELAVFALKRRSAGGSRRCSRPEGCGAGSSAEHCGGPGECEATRGARLCRDGWLIELALRWHGSLRGRSRRIGKEGSVPVRRGGVLGKSRTPRCSALGAAPRIVAAGRVNVRRHGAPGLIATVRLAEPVMRRCGPLRGRLRGDLAPANGPTSTTETMRASCAGHLAGRRFGPPPRPTRKLRMAAEAGLDLVSGDVRTMPRVFAAFIATRESPGPILIPPGTKAREAIESLVRARLAWTAEELRNELRWLPQ